MFCYMCVCMGFRWVFVYEKAYQVRDTAIESSVMTKVKGFGIYNDKVMDVADYVTPTQVWACHDLSCLTNSPALTSGLGSSSFTLPRPNLSHDGEVHTYTGFQSDLLDNVKRIAM